MNRSNVRIAVFSAGIVSALFLLLYLPVLIWSPPWGVDGYYEKPLPNDSLGYIFTPVYFNSKEIVYLMQHKEKTLNTVSHKCISSNNEWSHWNFAENYSAQTRFQFSNGVLKGVTVITTNRRGSVSKNFSYPKTSNPFILWYIKYLEWTSE